MDLGKRIADLRKKQGLTQSALADKAGIVQSSISDIEKSNRTVNLKNLEKICAALSVSLSEVFSESSTQTVSSFSDLPASYRRLSPSQKKLVDALIQEIARSNAGIGSTFVKKNSVRIAGDAAAGQPLYSPNDFDDDEIEVPEKYADKERFFPIRARGDSMEPKIHLGDVVIVQRDTPPDDGQIALVRLAGLADDEYTIKRVYYRNGNVTLKSYNKAYPPMTYAADAVRTCEKVVHIIPRS